MTYTSDVYLFHEKTLPLRDNEFVKPTFHVPFTHSTETFLHRKRVPFAHFTILVVKPSTQALKEIEGEEIVKEIHGDGSQAGVIQAVSPAGDVEMPMTAAQLDGSDFQESCQDYESRVPSFCPGHSAVQKNLVATRKKPAMRRILSFLLCHNQ